MNECESLNAGPQPWAVGKGAWWPVLIRRKHGPASACLLSLVYAASNDTMIVYLCCFLMTNM